MRSQTFWLVTAMVVFAIFSASRLVTNEYFFFAGYIVLQYVVLATAWNILGGYTGYVNFGTAGFFALGAYSSVVLHKLVGPPIPVLIVVGGVVSGIVGFGMGYLTLRLRGVFFAIATLALAIVLQTLITNWDYVGGSRGVYIIRPAQAPLIGGYIQYLFLLMLILAGIAVATARSIEHSTLGYGFAAIRDDEQAAEAAGVPTLAPEAGRRRRLSGALMGMAGAPLPYYVTYLDPASGFNLSYAVNSIAMPLIGGMTELDRPGHRRGPARHIQQVATVTISSALNLLIVGVLLVAFVIIAPNGIVGLIEARAPAEDGDDRAAARRPRSRQALRRLRRARQHRSRGARRRAGRAHRPERLGQEHARQLPVRHLAQREREGPLRRPHAGRASRASADAARARPQLSAAEAVHSLNLTENVRIPLLYTVNARPGARLGEAALAERCAELLQLVGLAGKAGRRPRDLTQIEMRKLELARAMAAAPKLLFADEAMAGLSHSEIEDILTLLGRLIEQGITIILIEHIMRAVMSFSERLVVLVAGRKIADGLPQEVIRNPEVERAYLGE